MLRYCFFFFLNMSGRREVVEGLKAGMWERKKWQREGPTVDEWLFVSTGRKRFNGREQKRQERG